MKKACKKYRSPFGFSLAEMIAAVTIGAMVLVTMLSIYRRAQNSAAAITRRLDSTRLPSEVLQRIAEDLDTIIGSSRDTRITINNKFEKGYTAAQLTIQKTITDEKNRTKQFETIVWRSCYDYENDANGLVLYRSHSGMALEDKLLDEKRADLEKQYPFVPICSGVTYFTIQVPSGENLLTKWTGTSLPRGIVATISFAEPFETPQGTLDVLEEEKITRTIAIDRTRKIKFAFAVAADEDEDEDENEDEDEDVEDEGDEKDGAADIEDEDEDKKDSEKPVDEKEKSRQR